MRVDRGVSVQTAPPPLPLPPRSLPRRAMPVRWDGPRAAYQPWRGGQPSNLAAGTRCARPADPGAARPGARRARRQLRGLWQVDKASDGLTRASCAGVVSCAPPEDRSMARIRRFSATSWDGRRGHERHEQAHVWWSSDAASRRAAPAARDSCVGVSVVNQRASHATSLRASRRPLKQCLHDVCIH